MTTAGARTGPWLYGPGRDLLFGCGLGYALLFTVFLLAGPAIRAGVPPILLPLLTLVVGAPHYGATLLRVYEQRDDRRAYALFTVHATVLLLVLFAIGTRVDRVASLLITVYITWSPWHYSGQNYGIAVMFLRRRGVPLDARTKGWLYASFLASFALTAIAVHGTGSSVAYAPAGPGETGAGIRFLPLGLPEAVAGPAFALAAGVYLVSLLIAATRLLGRASPRALTPVAVLALTQALWFSLPVAARRWGAFGSVEALGAEHYVYYFFWIALGHVVQYLWVTSYYARRTRGFGGDASYFTRCLLAGLAAFTVPALLFAPDLLGRTAFGLGLGALVAACVNLHHFVLDGAIWKLRDGRIARVLVRRDGATPAAPGDGGSVDGRVGLTRRPLRTLVLGLGALSLLVSLAATHETAFGLSSADPERLRSAIARLRWLGRESPLHQLRLAEVLAARDPQAALRAVERAVELHPSGGTWLLYGRALEARGRHAEALQAYRRGIADAPERADLHFRAGGMWLRQRELSRARAAFARAAALEPGRDAYAEALRRIEADVAAREGGATD